MRRRHAERRTRSVIVHPANGTAYPPLRMDRAGSLQGCPVNCKIDDWSQSSECTALCGSGVSHDHEDGGAKQRGRPLPGDESDDRVQSRRLQHELPAALGRERVGIRSEACQTGHEARSQRMTENDVCEGRGADHCVVGGPAHQRQQETSVGPQQWPSDR